MNGQSATKPLNINIQEEGSTTIPEGSTFVTGVTFGKGSNYYIYILIDPRSNKIRYVGKTIDLNRRSIKHISEAKRNKYTTAKDNWIRKLLSLDLKPIMQTIDICKTKLESSNLEIYYIQKLKKEGVELYNSTEGGDYTTLSTLSKPILRYTLKGEFIEEFKSISEASRKLDIKYSLLSGALNGRHKYYYNSIWKFKNNNIFSNKVEAVSYKGSKFILQYSLNNEFIKEWYNQKDAADYYNIDRSSIGNCCLGKSKTCNGFIWRYKN